MADHENTEHEDALHDAGEAKGPAGAKFSAPAEVWDAVRGDYLAGLSAPDCCRRHGVGLSAMRQRAAKEGWRRSDQPWTAPGPALTHMGPDDEGAMLTLKVGGDLDRVEPAELVRIAYRRMARAVMNGDAEGALRWRRVARIMLIEQQELETFIGRDLPDCAARRERDEDAQDDLDDLDDLDEENALDLDDLEDEDDPDPMHLMHLMHASDGGFGVQVVRPPPGPDAPDTFATTTRG